MNMPIRPNIIIEGDRPDRIMSRSGELVGISKTRAVWRFGFLPNSDAHKAYGVSVPAFHWVISEHNGKVLDRFEGYAIELPARYQAIINAGL